MNKFVFVLAPPYSGSTVLFRLIETSAHVSALPGEGQFLPEVTETMRAAPWDKGQPLPWADIRAAWETYWDKTKPLLLEKSPPNMIRARDIEAAFDPAFFVVLVRSPYAHIEGLARRAHVPPMNLPKNAGRAQAFARAAELWLSFAETQRETIAKSRNVAWLTYEQLTQSPDDAAAKLQAFLPELGALDTGARFGVHALEGTKARELRDMNETKRKLLTKADFEIINDVLGGHTDLLAFFGYELLEPREDQDWIALRNRSLSRLKRTWANIVKNLPGQGKTKQAKPN